MFLFSENDMCNRYPLDNPDLEAITPFYSEKKDNGKLQIVSPLQHAIKNNDQVIIFD